MTANALFPSGKGVKCKGSSVWLIWGGNCGNGDTVVGSELTVNTGVELTLVYTNIDVPRM